MNYIFRNISRFLAIVTIAVLVSSCNKTPSFTGSWRLSNFCYGTDCIEMGESDMIQIWEFTDNKTTLTDDTLSAFEWFDGRQSQDSTMNIPMAWRKTTSHDTGSCDTLFVVNKSNMVSDFFLVTRFDDDTLELSSMLKNMLVRQIFVRM
ncbi:MAG: hypothetical protein K6D59_02380 [Bacteroidales bacterium]|nr:hypothetical protein [Bacteroidales bacterium]